VLLCRGRNSAVTDQAGLVRHQDVCDEYPGIFCRMVGGLTPYGKWQTPS